MQRYRHTVNFKSCFIELGSVPRCLAGTSMLARAHVMPSRTRVLSPGHDASSTDKIRFEYVYLIYCAEIAGLTTLAYALLPVTVMLQIDELGQVMLEYLEQTRVNFLQWMEK